LCEQFCFKPYYQTNCKNNFGSGCNNCNWGIKKFAIQWFIICVYFKKESQFPQVENSLLHNPNLSATADKNSNAIASLKNGLIIFRSSLIL